MTNNNDAKALSVVYAVAAEIFGITALVLMLVWLLHFREGLNLNSHDPNRIFNVHPFLMFFGFMFFLAHALIIYRGRLAAIGILCRVVAICLGGVGIHAAIKSHHMLHFGSNVRSVHSWIGITAFSIFIFESALGILVIVVMLACGGGGLMEEFMEKLSRSGRSGRATLYMATCAAVSGLMEKAAKDVDGGRDRESTIINVLALFILLFAVSIDKAVVYADNARATRLHA